MPKAETPRRFNNLRNKFETHSEAALLQLWLHCEDLLPGCIFCKGIGFLFLIRHIDLAAKIFRPTARTMENQAVMISATVGYRNCSLFPRRSKGLWGTYCGFTHTMPFPCRSPVVPLPCLSAKGLDCVFPI
jgi:hypothetical protein